MWKDNRRYSQSSCPGGKYYFSRNIPHPRMVCHIPGLNNAPVCVVRSSFSREYSSTGNKVIPKQEADQEHVLTGEAMGDTSANCYLPKLKGFMRRELGSSQSMTQGCADVPERIQNNPTSSEKLLKKRFQASAQPANRQGIHVAPLTQSSTPFANLRYSPCIQENVNSDLSCLDQEIKVLEKLSKILKTDSLTEIQQWFARAGKKERDYVSGLIYAERTDKGVLNSKECPEDNMNSLNPLKTLPPLQRGPEREVTQSRSSAKESVANQNMKQEREKESLLLPTPKKQGPAQQTCCFQGRTATEKVPWKQETVLPSCSVKSLTCATATPKQQIPPLQQRPPYSEPLKRLPAIFT